MQLFKITDALDNLSLRYDDRGNEANALCPMHEARTGKEDRSPSWFINLETGQHICFSCGYKGSLLLLICDVNNFYTTTWGIKEADYEAAKQWLSTVTEVTVERLAELMKDLPAYIMPAPKPVEMSEARLAVFVAPPQEELKKRYATAVSAEAYGVLWDSTKKNWILPLREPHFNKLMGWQEKGTVTRTFMNRPAGLQKSKTLFGIENQDELCTIVVESPLDCLRLHSAGVVGAVAICGSSISEDQIRLLRYSQKVIAAFDTDNAGNKASKEMLKWARLYGLNLYFFNYGDSGAKDPGDLTDEQITWGIANAKSSILGESAYVSRGTKTVSS